MGGGGEDFNVGFYGKDDVFQEHAIKYSLLLNSRLYFMVKNMLRYIRIECAIFLTSASWF